MDKQTLIPLRQRCLKLWICRRRFRQQGWLNLGVVDCQNEALEAVLIKLGSQRSLRSL